MCILVIENDVCYKGVIGIIWKLSFVIFFLRVLEYDFLGVFKLVEFFLIVVVEILVY